MAQVRKEHQQPVGHRREHTTGQGVVVGDRHHMAEVIVGRLKFQLPAFVRRIRQHKEDCTQLVVAMAVQINRSAIPGTHHGTGFLDVGHKTVIQAKQRTETDRYLLGQLPVQPQTYPCDATDLGRHGPTDPR